MVATSARVCRACREEINAKAKICPHCRTKQANSKSGLVAGLVVVGILAAVAVWPHSGPSTEGSKVDASANAQSDDAAFIEHHGNNPKALDDRFSSKAQVECSSGADDYLRSIAVHDFAWDDDAKGWLGDKFDKFSLQSPGLGLLSLLSTRAKLSNGFGAFQHIEFYCLYNAASGDVVRFSQTDPADDVTPVAGPENHPNSTVTKKPVVIYQPKSEDTTAPDDNPKSNVSSPSSIVTTRSFKGVD